MYRQSHSCKRGLRMTNVWRPVVPRRMSPTHTVNQACCSCPDLPLFCFIMCTHNPSPTLEPSAASSSHWKHPNPAHSSVLPGSPGRECRPELQARLASLIPPRSALCPSRGALEEETEFLSFALVFLDLSMGPGTEEELMVK